MGTVLEAKLDRGRGPVATVLVRNGTLRVGDYFICGAVFGKVRAMIRRSRRADPQGRAVHAGRSAGARIAARSRRRFPGGHRHRQGQADRQVPRPQGPRGGAGQDRRLTLEQLHKQMAAGEIKELPIILKADVGGSAEVLTEALQKLSNDKVKVRVIRAGVGAINESDVLLASASNAIIIGFNVRPERNAARRWPSRKRSISACTPSFTT
jgi:translation initiation factor IF-2